MCMCVDVGSHPCFGDDSNIMRAQIPPLKTILKRMRDANDPDNAIEDEFHPRRSAVYVDCVVVLQ